MTPALISSLGFRRIAAISPVVRVADTTANVSALIAASNDAISNGAEIIVTPELSITGYTLGDLVRLPDVLEGARQGLETIRQWSAGHNAVVVVGLPLEVGSQLFNAAAVVQGGSICAVIPKTYLPSSNEFYERRWFVSGALATRDRVMLGDEDVPFGTDLLIADANDPHCIVGVEICEDLWAVEPPSGRLAIAGATLILNLSASNELVGKAAYRRSLVVSQSARTLTAYAYASSGPSESTTDTVYSGHCMVAENGALLCESDRLNLHGSMVMADVDLKRCGTDRLHTSSFSTMALETDYRVVEVDLKRSVKQSVQRAISSSPFVPAIETDRAERCREILALQATALAMRWKHTGSARLVIGVSGGLDSTLALLACRQACDVLGVPHSRILALTMPGFGTTQRTRQNAEALCAAIGCELRTIPIDAAVRQHFADIGHDEADHTVVFENAQARERTQILMDVANGESGVVVGTGDMSELALGWCTYNADQMSMYSVNGGVPKTLVQHVIRWYADDVAEDDLAQVLEDILATPISPELLPPGEQGQIVQRTEDVIGPYDVHDFFLYHVVRMQQPVRTIAILAMIAFADRYTPAQILAWFDVFLRRFFQHQFKRSAMPDGVKIGSVVLSPRADWRMPSDAHPTVWINALNELRSEIGG